MTVNPENPRIHAPSPRRGPTGRASLLDDVPPSEAPSLPSRNHLLPGSIASTAQRSRDSAQQPTPQTTPKHLFPSTINDYDSDGVADSHEHPGPGRAILMTPPPNSRRQVQGTKSPRPLNQSSHLTVVQSEVSTPGQESRTRQREIAPTPPHSSPRTSGTNILRPMVASPRYEAERLPTTLSRDGNESDARSGMDANYKPRPESVADQRRKGLESESRFKNSEIEFQALLTKNDHLTSEVHKLNEALEEKEKQCRECKQELAKLQRQYSQAATSSKSNLVDTIEEIESFTKRNGELEQQVKDLKKEMEAVLKLEANRNKESAAETKGLRAQIRILEKENHKQKRDLQIGAKELKKWTKFHMNMTNWVDKAYKVQMDLDIEQITAFEEIEETLLLYAQPNPSTRSYDSPIGRPGSSLERTLQLYTTFQDDFGDGYIPRSTPETPADLTWGGRVGRGPSIISPMLGQAVQPLLRHEIPKDVAAAREEPDEKATNGGYEAHEAETMEYEDRYPKDTSNAISSHKPLHSRPTSIDSTTKRSPTKPKGYNFGDDSSDDSNEISGSGSSVPGSRSSGSSTQNPDPSAGRSPLARIHIASSYDSRYRPRERIAAGQDSSSDGSHLSTPPTSDVEINSSERTLIEESPISPAGTRSVNLRLTIELNASQEFDLQVFANAVGEAIDMATKDPSKRCFNIDTDKSGMLVLPRPVEKSDRRLNLRDHQFGDCCRHDTLDRAEGQIPSSCTPGPRVSPSQRGNGQPTGDDGFLPETDSDIDTNADVNVEAGQGVLKKRSKRTTLGRIKKKCAKWSQTAINKYNFSNNTVDNSIHKTVTTGIARVKRRSNDRMKANRNTGTIWTMFGIIITTLTTMFVILGQKLPSKCLHTIKGDVFSYPLTVSQTLSVVDRSGNQTTTSDVAYSSTYQDASLTLKQPETSLTLSSTSSTATDIWASNVVSKPTEIVVETWLITIEMPADTVTKTEQFTTTEIHFTPMPAGLSETYRVAECAPCKPCENPYRVETSTTSTTSTGSPLTPTKTVTQSRSRSVATKTTQLSPDHESQNQTHGHSPTATLADWRVTDIDRYAFVGPGRLGWHPWIQQILDIFCSESEQWVLRTLMEESAPGWEDLLVEFALLSAFCMLAVVAGLLKGPQTWMRGVVAKARSGAGSWAWPRIGTEIEAGSRLGWDGSGKQRV